MKLIVEWTSEGGPKSMESRRRREPNPLPIRSVCLYMRKWTFVNLSGTAIIRNYYRLKHSLGRFFISREKSCFRNATAFFLTDKPRRIGSYLSGRKFIAERGEKT